MASLDLVRRAAQGRHDLLPRHTGADTDGIAGMAMNLSHAFGEAQLDAAHVALAVVRDAGIE